MSLRDVTDLHDGCMKRGTKASTEGYKILIEEGDVYTARYVR